MDLSGCGCGRVEGRGDEGWGAGRVVVSPSSSKKQGADGRALTREEGGVVPSSSVLSSTVDSIHSLRSLDDEFPCC